jgi:tRNA/tmRNA/rRNA uracil-C5-methylase (TrmA/RlmC/RlmD family)
VKVILDIAGGKGGDGLPANLVAFLNLVSLFVNLTQQRVKTMSEIVSPVRPTLDRIIIRKVTRDKVTPGGLMLPDVVDDRPHLFRAVVLATGPGRREVVEGSRESVQRVGDRVWRIPVNGFWQSHRDAAQTYSDLVRQWADGLGARRAWDLYGGAGLFAATLAESMGKGARVLSVDTARSASAAARAALGDLPAVKVVSGSVRGFLAGQSRAADVAVLDPPRAGAGRAVIDLLARAGVPRVIHIGCEAASFARDIGLYRGNGYAVEALRVFDAFPLTHHVECVALLTRRP